MLTSPFLRSVPLQSFIPIPVIQTAHQRVDQFQSVLFPHLYILVMCSIRAPFLAYRLQVDSYWLLPPVRLSHDYPTLQCRHLIQ